MRSAVSPFISIDIDAARIALTDPTGLFPDGHEDDRPFYGPFADRLHDDPRMTDLQRGLGELGLIAVQVPDVESADPGSKTAYIHALLGYDVQLLHRAALLPLDDELRGGVLENLYPNDPEWIADYVEVLLAMRDTVRRTRLFAYAQDRRDDPGVEALRKRTVPKYNVTVQQNPQTGALKIKRLPRSDDQLQQAA